LVFLPQLSSIFISCRRLTTDKLGQSDPLLHLLDYFCKSPCCSS
jgi:hypothetical protein